MAAKAAASYSVEQDPHAETVVVDDDEIDLSTTPAADFVVAGITGLATGLNICPEASTSSKRIKMIHKKGDVEVADAGLKFKWNADYKAGKLTNLRIVTVKDKAGGDAESGESAAEDGAVAGKKRARKEFDLKKALLQAHDALVDQGKASDAEALKAVLEKL